MAKDGKDVTAHSARNDSGKTHRFPVTGYRKLLCLKVHLLPSNHRWLVLQQTHKKTSIIIIILMILIIASRYDYQLREAAAASSGFDALSQSQFVPKEGRKRQKKHTDRRSGRKISNQGAALSQGTIAQHNYY